jgi:hypothetical protein
MHVLKLYYANFEFLIINERVRKFIALIFIYYVFIDVLVAPRKNHQPTPPDKK